MEKSCVITDDQHERRKRKKQSASVSSNEDCSSSSSEYGSEDTASDSPRIDSPQINSPRIDPRKDSIEKPTKQEHQKSSENISIENLPSSMESTPSVKLSMMKSNENLIKGFPRTQSAGYGYYVIASPIVDQKIRHNRSYSFVSISSTGSSPSEVSSVIQSKKRAPRSRGLLQSVKDKLLKEIESIDTELEKMDCEKLILSNLRNATLHYRDMICQSERNNQGIPNAQKLRNIVESIELKIMDEELAVDVDISIPHIECVKKDMQEFIKICNLITNNKIDLKISMVEELLTAIGKLYGEVDTLLKIFYEHDDAFVDDDGDDDDSEELIRKDETEESGSSTTTENGEETRNTEVNNGYANIALDQNENVESPIKEYLSNQNGSNTSLETFLLSPISPSPSEEFGNVAKILRNLNKKLSKAKKLFKTIERLSSGNPKPKSLRSCFKDISTILKDNIYVDLERAAEEHKQQHGSNENWSKCIMGNINALQDHLRADRPGERELEHIRIIVGELTGRINMILKNNMLD